jgi:hypothetical protein
LLLPLLLLLLLLGSLLLLRLLLPLPPGVCPDWAWSGAGTKHLLLLLLLLLAACNRPSTGLQAVPAAQTRDRLLHACSKVLVCTMSTTLWRAVGTSIHACMRGACTCHHSTLLIGLLVCS